MSNGRSISSRKTDHIALCQTGDVGFRKRTTLLEEVHFLHDALPELALSDIETTTVLFGKELSAPIVIAAMTGGTPEAARINTALASIAEELGLGFGLGSQRAMHAREDATPSYRVRDVARTALLLGNIGVVQARNMTAGQVLELAREIDADAMCVHLNPAMELVQAGGDRDFRGCLATVSRLATELPIPVIVKETGSGISGAVGRKLRGAGVAHVDVSGAGGTSWVGVEAERAKIMQHETGARLGETFWDWGIPTAASVAAVVPLGFTTVIATGGIATGLDVARALALGAHAAGIARPVLRAYARDGIDGARRFLQATIDELRAAMLLTGVRRPAALTSAPRVVGPELRAWTDPSQWEG